MKKLRFKNKEGKEIKTILSDDIMYEMSNLIEQELKNNGIYYTRDGTKFNVQQNDLINLLEAQMNANKKLILNGTITMDMIRKDVDANLLY